MNTFLNARTLSWYIICLSMKDNSMVTAFELTSPLNILSVGSQLTIVRLDVCMYSLMYLRTHRRSTKVHC